MGRELELKYCADAQKLAEVERDYAGQPCTVYEMETTYYDVPSGILGRLRWTFRRRLENGVSVCTLKTDLPDGSRGEWSVECGDIRDSVTALIAQGAPEELSEYTAEGVLPVCGARFTRNAYTICGDGCTIELALDRGVLLGGGREQPLCEIEAELKDGRDSDLMTFCSILEHRYSLVRELRSKITRARFLAGISGN